MVVRLCGRITSAKLTAFHRADGFTSDPALLSTNSFLSPMIKCKFWMKFVIRQRKDGGDRDWEHADEREEGDTVSE